MLYFAACMLILEITYRFIEKKISVSRQSIVVSFVWTMILAAFSLNTFMNAGVIRDVPELGISKAKAYRHMNAEYTDRIYEYDRDFANGDERPNVLLIGNSYTRDLANVFLESAIAEKIEMSYVYSLMPL